jgi:hypothetical protein
MTLVNDVCQKVSICDDDFPIFECRPDHLFDQLSSGGHVEKHFAATTDRSVGIGRKQHVADPLA